MGMGQVWKPVLVITYFLFVGLKPLAHYSQDGLTDHSYIEASDGNI